MALSRQSGLLKISLFLFCGLVLFPPQIALAGPQTGSGANSAACTGVAVAENSIQDPAAKQVWEYAHPSCYTPVSVGSQDVVHAVNHIVGEVLSATQGIAYAILAVIAAPLLAIVGIRIALGVESGVMIPVGRAILALSLAYGGVTFLPGLINGFINQSQIWGTATGQSMAPLLKADMSVNPIFTSSSSSGLSTFLQPSAVQADPISILKMGLEDSWAVMELILHSHPKITSLSPSVAIGQSFQWFIGGLLGLAAAVGVLFIFTYIAAKTFSILLRAHVIVALAPIMAALHSVSSVKGFAFSNMYSIHHVITLAIRESFKLYLIYLIIPVLLAFQVEFFTLAFKGIA